MNIQKRRVLRGKASAWRPFSTREIFNEFRTLWTKRIWLLK